MSSTIPDPSFLKWPAGSSDDYITARRALLQKEYALLNQADEVAAQRRALPPGPVLPTYTLEEGPENLSDLSPARKVTLADIARSGELGHKTLVIYHMMMGENDSAACLGCSMFIDGLNGVAKHAAQLLNLVIVAKAPLPAIREYARKRGWHHLRFVSSFGSNFNQDMGVEAPPWMENMQQAPAMSVFQYDEDGGDGVVRFCYQTTPHFGKINGKDDMRGLDLLNPIWSLLDSTPEGRRDWDFSLVYAEE